MAAALDQSQHPVESLAGAPATEAAPSSITPPNSANGKTDAPDGMVSDLSDLELDGNAKKAHARADPAPADAPAPAEAEGDVEPDHFYDGGRIPVFKPVCFAFLLCLLYCFGFVLLG